MSTATREEIEIAAHTAALVALAEHGVASDVQEYLTYGNQNPGPTRAVPPGALKAAVRAALTALESLSPGAPEGKEGRRTQKIIKQAQAQFVAAVSSLKHQMVADKEDLFRYVAAYSDFMCTMSELAECAVTGKRVIWERFVEEEDGALDALLTSAPSAPETREDGE